METMQENPPKTPQFKGDGVAVWVNLDKNGKKYLSIKVLDSINLRAFAYEPKPKDPTKL